MGTATYFPLFQDLHACWYTQNQIHVPQLWGRYSPLFRESFSVLHIFKKNFIILQLQLSPFFPHCSPLTCQTPLSHTQSFTCPVVLVHGSLVHVPWFAPSPSSLHYSPPHPSGHPQCVLYFQVSGSVLLACLFCWLGSTYRWDHMVFVPHRLAYFT